MTLKFETHDAQNCAPHIRPRCDYGAPPIECDQAAAELYGLTPDEAAMLAQ
jgi:hypothetical protein